MARDYKRLDIYHLAYSFVLEVYKKTENFPKKEEQNITSQLRRASVSIPLNIVEGSAKSSNREFFYFLNVAYASAKETEVLLKLSHDLGYIDNVSFGYLFHKLDELNARLFLFIRSVEQKVHNKKFNFFQKFEKEQD